MSTDKITPLATLLIPIFNKKFEDYGSYLETEIGHDEIRSILSNEGYCESIIKDYLDHRTKLELARVCLDSSISASQLGLSPLRAHVQNSPSFRACP